jgi:hypothetical protein
MISVSTGNPGALLQAIKKAIDDKKISTWNYDKDGDFIHEAAQWKDKGFLRASLDQTYLHFSFYLFSNRPLEKDVLGVFHGRFAEMLVNHFEGSFSSIAISNVRK